MTRIVARLAAPSQTATAASGSRGGAAVREGR
jgi:hypothetical protein